MAVVFALDIAMDVKFRKLFETEFSGYRFSGSFPWVHFNVFCVRILLGYVDSDFFEGSNRIFVHDSVVCLHFIEETMAWLSTR